HHRGCRRCPQRLRAVEVACRIAASRGAGARSPRVASLSRTQRTDARDRTPPRRCPPRPLKATRKLRTVAAARLWPSCALFCAARFGPALAMEGTRALFCCAAYAPAGARRGPARMLGPVTVLWLYGGGAGLPSLFSKRQNEQNQRQYPVPR